MKQPLCRVCVYVCLCAVVVGKVRAHGVECVIIIPREKVEALICLFFLPPRRWDVQLILSGVITSLACGSPMDIYKRYAKKPRL